MYSHQQIKDLKEKLAVFSNNYITEMAKKTGISTSTVFRFFNCQPTRPTTADKIYDAGLAFIEQQERKQAIRTEKAKRLIYGEDLPEDQPGQHTGQGRLHLNS